jgi:hypothetical protein
MGCVASKNATATRTADVVLNDRSPDDLPDGICDGCDAMLYPSQPRWWRRARAAANFIGDERPIHSSAKGVCCEALPPTSLLTLQQSSLARFEQAQ